MTYLKSFFTLFSVIGIILLSVSCNQEKPKIPAIHDNSKLKEAMANANGMLTSLENEKISSFITRYGWKMEQSGSGLRYFIYKTTQGIMPVKGDSVLINYSLMLLNGEKLYSSATDGPLIFETGKGKTISGLEEGIFLMHMGEKAKLIVPSHLAFGLLGDQKKIPQRATLVYDVELTSVKKRQ